MITKEEIAAASHKHSLSDEEVWHLNDLAFGGLMQKRLPDHVKSSLLERKLIDNRIGGEVILRDGYAALAAHKQIGQKR